MTTQISNSETIRNTFNFSIDKFPLTGPENMATPFYGLFRSDTCEVVHDKSVSSDYVPHTTEDVLAITEATESVFGDCVPRCHFNKGHYVDLAPSNAQRLAVYGTRDNVFPRLRLSACYNGRAFKLFIGFYRDACRNLAELVSVQSTSTIIRHDGNLRDKMEELVAQFSSLQNGWENLQDTIVRMEANRTSLSDFLVRVYGEAPTEQGSGRTRHENRTRDIVRRVINERNITGRPAFSAINDEISAWEAFNAVQGYVQHKQTRRGNTCDFDRQIKATESTDVRKAEKLALAVCA